MQGALIVLKMQDNNFTYLELNSTYLEFILTYVKLNLTYLKFYNGYVIKLTKFT